MKEIRMYQGPGPTDARMLDVAVGPHSRAGAGLAQIHQRWVIALLPAVAASFYYFGFASLRLFGLCVLFAVAIDWLIERMASTRDLTSNWSSVMYALMLGFMLPIGASWWLILTACFLMVFIGKKLFGGAGGFPAHPAVLSIAVLQLSWPARMDYTAALKNLDWQITMVEPLRLLKALGASAESHYQWTHLLLGRQVAGAAEGMVLFVLIGGLFLLALRQVQWQVPIGFILGLVVTAMLLRLSDPQAFASPLFYLFSGGTLFMALFLLPDHTTSPVNRIPMFCYGLVAGVLLMLIRAYSLHVDGIVYAVLLANLCTPLLDMIKPRVKGGEDV